MAVRNREYNFHLMCDWCGAYFDASRSDARFCTPAHRAKYHRRELKRSQQVERIKRAIDDLLMNSRLEVADMLARDIAGYALTYTVKTVGDK